MMHQLPQLSSSFISQNPMVDPVMAADGFVYERSAIARHLTTVGPRSPLTNAPLAHLSLLPCHTLRGAGDMAPSSVRHGNMRCMRCMHACRTSMLTTVLCVATHASHHTPTMQMMTSYSALSSSPRPAHQPQPGPPLSLRDHSSGSGMSRTTLHEPLRGGHARGWDGSFPLHSSGVSFHPGLMAMHGMLSM